MTKPNPEGRRAGADHGLARGAAEPSSLRGGVLVTGATGFLGAHLLLELISAGCAPVTCLVRGSDEGEAARRLFNQLRWYFPELRSEAREAVEVVLGDIGEERLGLEQRTLDDMAGRIRTVFNVAADVRHVGQRERFFRTNAHSARELLEFARRGCVESLHHVSSVAVKGSYATPPHFSAFRETHLDEGQTFPNHPYAESKFQAELTLRDAAQRGLACTIYRVGNVGPHWETGRYQRNIGASSLALHARSCTRLGLSPYGADWRFRITPVDDMARAILLLAQSSGSAGKTYHLDSPHQLRQYDVVRALQAVGYPIRLIGACDFEDVAVRLSQDDEALAAMLKAAASDHGKTVPIDSSWTESQLSALGFEYRSPSGQWLMKFIDHAIGVGFLSPPRFWNEAPLLEALPI